MPTVSEIQAIHITLEIDGNNALFVLLANDGTVNRLGTGAVDNSETSLFIGVTDPPLIDEVMKSLNDEMLEHMGGYEIPDQKGASCLLTIGFQFSGGEENGFRFSYGAESEGPPGEIIRLVIAAVEATEPWYTEQKEATNQEQ